MMTRRNFVQTAAAAVAATALTGRTTAARAASPLQWKHFPTGDKGFFRAPVLLSGAKEAIAAHAKKGIGEDLALRVYTTRLLGGEPKLVLHGGGNTCSGAGASA